MATGKKKYDQLLLLSGEKDFPDEIDTESLKKIEDLCFKMMTSHIKRTNPSKDGDQDE